MLALAAAMGACGKVADSSGDEKGEGAGASRSPDAGAPDPAMQDAGVTEAFDASIAIDGSACANLESRDRCDKPNGYPPRPSLDDLASSCAAREGRGCPRFDYAVDEAGAVTEIVPPDEHQLPVASCIAEHVACIRWRCAEAGRYSYQFCTGAK
jgi:hypothetical protein